MVTQSIYSTTMTRLPILGDLPDRRPPYFNNFIRPPA